MHLHKPESPSGQDKSRKPKKVRSKGAKIVAAILTCAAVMCVAWLAVLVGLVPGPYVDYGPAPTPEDARAYLLDTPDYGKVEFLGYVKSEDDTTNYTEGGKLPAGWVGYKFHITYTSHPDWGTTVELYPCLFERNSLEWTYNVLLLRPSIRSSGWHYFGSAGLAKYHNRCNQPGGIADFHNVPEGSA